MLDLVARARSIVTEAKDKLEPMVYLRTVIRQMSREDVDALALAYLYAQVKNRQRSNVLVLERAAERMVKPKYGTRKYEEWAARPENADEAEQDTGIRIEMARDEARAASQMWKDISGALDRYKNELRIEWTRELLDSKFATGDGSRVRWGDATRVQHEDRIAMHRRNAAAGLEGIARHEKAIETLNATGCSTLREAVKVAA